MAPKSSKDIVEQVGKSSNSNTVQVVRVAKYVAATMVKFAQYPDNSAEPSTVDVDTTMVAQSNRPPNMPYAHCKLAKKNIGYARFRERPQGPEGPLTGIVRKLSEICGVLKIL